MVSNKQNGEKIIQILYKNDIFDLLCFLNLAEQGEMTANNLVNIKLRSV